MHIQCDQPYLLDANFYLMNLESESRHLVILHGYLFEGSGSNIYVQNIAMSWKAQGHKVTVICQDRKVSNNPAVDYYIRGMPSEDTPKLKPGQLRIIVPDIDDLLPVYVMNEYEGYKVKCAEDMSEEEIENYLEKTGKCLKALTTLEKVDKVLTNHAIFSPTIAARALEGTGIPFDIKIHGSAIVYSLKPHPKLFKYAIPGLKHATKIYTGTEYVRTQVLEVFKDHAEELDLGKKLHILSPGMDPDKFCIPESLAECQKQLLMRVKEKIKNVPDGRKEHSIPIDVNPENLHDLLVEETKKYNQRVIDADFIERWQPYSDDEQTILYIGALINTKGMGELLAMAPHLILQRPGLKFIFCGFGTYREHMSQLLNAFEEGDLQKAKTIASTGDFITEIKIEDFFFKIDKKIKDRIMLVGYTEHNLLSKILPLCTICVVPSRLPEAFGMVTVESMAAGVLPICNNHTGLSDVLDLIEREFPELTSITRVKKEDFFKNLPQIILELLKFREVYSEGNQKLKERIRAISVNNFSWGAIAKKLGQ